MLPIIFESSFFTLYSYPLFMGLSWGLGFYLTHYLFEKNKVSTEGLRALFAGFFLSSWIGAKLFFLMISSQQNFEKYLYADAFWLGGGFVFYGGLILGLVFFFIYSYWFKKFPIKESRLLIPGLVWGHGVGRIGCFFTGCCYGKQCSLPWAVKMHGEWVHPVQIYEALGLFIIGGFVLKWLKEKKEPFFIVSRYLLYYSILRFFVEIFRGDKVRGVFWYNFSTSQLISAALFFIVILAIIKRRGALAI